LDREKGNYTPRINFDKCTHCGLCSRVCPGASVDFDQLNVKIFEKLPIDFLIGNYLNFYMGYSTDYEIRYNSSSGGLITELLIFALEKGIIDGVLVTRMSAKDPLLPEPFLAKTKAEVIAASKSKYCPVPVNVAIKELLKEEGRFAVVGLPCHIQGIRKAALVNERLRTRLAFTFGLMCSYNRNFLAIEYVLQKLTIKKEEVVKLDYRGQGYLGHLCVELKSGEKKFVPFAEYYNRWLKSFFYIPRCTLCIDHTCELADISFGDNWMSEFQKEPIGNSIIISRTKFGENLLTAASNAGRIDLVKADYRKVVQSKKGTLTRKKNYLGARIALFKLVGKKTPFYNQPLKKGNILAYADAFSVYLQIYMSKKTYLRRFLGPFATIISTISQVFKKMYS